MTMSIAFFLSDMGDLIYVLDNHIATVIRDPERFGVTPAEIQTVYGKYGERIGVEGEARRKLLIEVIRGGWIRLRRYPNQHWSVTARSLAPTVQALLRGWAEKMLSGTYGFREQDRYLPVKGSTPEGETICTIGDLADGSCHVYQVSEND